MGSDEDYELGSENEEDLYENLEQLREMIGDDDHRARVGDVYDKNAPGKNDQDEENVIDSELNQIQIEGSALVSPDDKRSDKYAYQDELDDDLLAEFSDYGEFSDDDYDEQDFMDAIREASNFKIKRKTKGKNRKVGGTRRPQKARRERVLDPEVKQLLSEANEAFVRSDIQVAEQLYNEVIKKDVKNFAAYKTLGDIYQLQGRYNDCCNSWFLAAHLNPSDWEFWKVVATLSAELGHVRQAIYCYTRAIRMNNEEWECIYGRSILYKQTGQLGRSLEGFQRLYNHNPLDANILRELAVLYVEYNRTNEAIGLYLKIFEANVARREALAAISENAIESSGEETGEEDDEDSQDHNSGEIDSNLGISLQVAKKVRKTKKKFRCIAFDWSSLNILAELYLKLIGESNGLKVIKKCARWIQDRENQTFWNDVPDDSEFDKRRFKNAKFDALTTREKEKAYVLPIDIRVRLGLLRLNNKNVLEAMNHFQFLYDEVFDDIADLYFVVAGALAKAEQYSEAIEFFTPLLRLEDYCILDVYEPLSRCYKEIEDYSNAKKIFEKLVELEPQNLETKLTLAEIQYHLSDYDTFNQLLLEVVEARKVQAAEAGQIPKPISSEIVGSVVAAPGKPLLEDVNMKRNASKKRRTPQDAERERQEREKRITAKVLDKYNKLKIYREGMEYGQESQTTLWLDTASDLIDVFSSVKNFFIKSRSRRFVGIIKRTRKFNKIIDYKIERLSKLSEGENLLDGLPLMEERVTLTSAEELRGLTYDQWFELFMELALMVTKLQSIEDGLSIIDTAQEVNVFVQNSDRVKMMKFVKLAIVLQTSNEEELINNLRGVLNLFQFNRKVYQSFLFCLAKGQLSMDILSSTVQQKFFLRQLKAFDSLRLSQHVSGQASITNKKVQNPNNEKSPYLHYIYAILLYSSKGFLLALQYLSRLKEQVPQDPMIDFMMGLAHLHRSMQRLTASRHFQILHGLRYLFEYYELRTTKYSVLEQQEADYNIGRAFHLLGLFSLAVHFYRKVCEDYEDQMLKRHAAYNCMLIYNESGNHELANSVMEKYLTV
ncbi:LAMI_0F02300g1_1 [Lachancea mirantina]|uniref:LAMI_0F02300g1_1 n=1 Tax=Lachancea mirantina TaxID=1230905 RepID=A0A1G4JWF0_9SACH|nr:LAMI_0F02300g1_1 [Lachancea mirantina]